ncbi:ABC transporter permease [Atlantibacter subterranea]|uniref:Transport permease protein n=1 Tax=Atlantibacter subterraneus TaxID=255519 RepID=A0A3R9GEN8_9ENTR|nr:ABC transporter permease [Atlantibacter subterranea]MDA3133971.1 ABC transporter permease [Atlantibacter subterranea]RSB64560.1 ABC transporter permease [Atlantibacter subterranea]RSE07651.1 ABC transporter permease [Atlantibacter subterranea]RSE29364.1 ABC transporter permease [Atlantibacter subterranea]
MKDLLLSIYRYRGFILGSVKREFQVRYKTSMLGAAWLILQPLSLILVYTLIFSEIMQAKLPNVTGAFAYSIYLCSGVLTWGLFAEILGRSVSVFLENANMLKKLNFPRICLPVIVVVSAILNFLIIFTIFSIFLIVTGQFPYQVIVAIIPLLVIQIAFTVGLGMVLGVMNVFFRDIGQFIAILIQFWFWFTPIVYTVNIVPEWAKNIIMMNPLSKLVVSYQNIMVYQKWPDWELVLPVAVTAVVLCTLGMYMFRKFSADMVDEL